MEVLLFVQQMLKIVSIEILSAWVIAEVILMGSVASHA
jgi:hypothetical protein